MPYNNASKYSQPVLYFYVSGGGSSAFLVESLDMKMTLKKRIASILTVGAITIGATLAAPVAANATGNPSKLDQGDLSLACKLQYGQSGWNAQLYGNTAYSWKCVSAAYPGQKRDVSVNNYCQSIWGVWAMTTNPNSPYSWKCQGY